MTIRKGFAMYDIPQALQYASPLGWGIIAAVVIFAAAHGGLGTGGAVAAAALAGFIAKTVLVDMI
jgi:hypothetical protein